MQTRPFGNTFLQVTPLGFGGGQVGAAEVPEEDAQKLLNHVLDSGVNLIDTARGYGLSEERIGKYISHRRDEFVLSTKIGYSVEGYEDWTPPIIVAGIERALILLKTDVLDIVHLHSCPLETLKNGGVVEALHKCNAQGKFKVAAYSGENEALEWAINSGLFGSVQTSVNVTDQRSLLNYLPKAKEKGIGVIAKRPAANAFWRFKDKPVRDYSEEYWTRWQTMKPETHGMDIQELCLRFSAYALGVSSAIAGTGSIEHFDKNLEIVRKGPLPSETAEALNTAFKEHDKGWTGQV